MQANIAFAFLCLVISVGAQRNHRLTCYLDVLTHHTLGSSCTHIVLPSISSDEDLHLQSLSENDYATLRNMKKRNPTLKILLGLEVKSSRLELMFANIGDFTQTLLTYLKDKSLDGLDVIWLDDISSDASNRNTELFMDILKNLKDGFEKDTDPLLLSVSVLDADDHSYDEKTLSQYVDFISLVTAHLENDGPYINKTVQSWKDGHVDLQKLNLAMPSFLWRSHRRHHHSNRPNHDAIREEGKKDLHLLNSYLGNQVCQAIKNGQERFSSGSSNMQSLTEEVLQRGFGGIGLVIIDPNVFSNSICTNITQDERAIVESKTIVLSHYGPRHHGYGYHNHHHHNHHHHHHHHTSHLPHNHSRHHSRPGQHHSQHGHHYHGRHHHHHQHHQHHHHHHHPIAPQSNITLKE